MLLYDSQVFYDIKVVRFYASDRYIMQRYFFKLSGSITLLGIGTIRTFYLWFLVSHVLVSRFLNLWCPVRDTRAFYSPKFILFQHFSEKCSLVCSNVNLFSAILSDAPRHEIRGR